MADLTPQLLPDNDEPLDGASDAAVLETLSLTGPPDVVVSQDPPPPVGRSWAFDFQRKTFLPEGGHGPLASSGDDTLVYWIEKALQTAKGAHPAHAGTVYGMVDPFREVGRMIGTAEKASLQARIHDALTFHPRITDVVNFSAYQDPDDDALLYDFTVIKDDGDAVPVVGLAV